MILFSVEAQQQLECVCEDGGQTESNHNIQDRSEVSPNLSPVERESDESSLVMIVQVKTILIMHSV